MGKIPRSSPFYGLSGRLGNMVFRQVKGETIVVTYNGSRKSVTSGQRKASERFRGASRQAKAALLDPVVCTYYEKKKVRMNLTSAYVAAVTDILRNGCLDRTDTPKQKRSGPRDDLKKPR